MIVWVDTKVSRTPLTLTEIAGVYFRQGNFTFGGGNPTVAALQRELVTRRHWLDLAQFSLSYALARITPGTNLLAFCVATGWLMRRWRGAFIALIAASVPSCALVAVLTGQFEAWSSLRLVQVAVAGALAASVGILLASFWQIIHPHLKRGLILQSCAIVSGSIALSMYAHLSPILVLMLAALAGFLWKDPA